MKENRFWWRQFLPPGMHATPFPVPSLPPNFLPISPYPQSQRNSYYCFFFFSHYVTVSLKVTQLTLKAPVSAHHWPWSSEI